MVQLEKDYKKLLDRAQELKSQSVQAESDALKASGLDPVKYGVVLKQDGSVNVVEKPKEEKK